jgi:hypothetical protein
LLPDDRARLTHIEEAIVAAMEFTESRSRSELGTDLMPRRVAKNLDLLKEGLTPFAEREG